MAREFLVIAGKFRQRKGVSNMRFKMLTLLYLNLSGSFTFEASTVMFIFDAFNTCLGGNGLHSNVSLVTNMNL